MENFGERMKARRKQLGYSLRRLGEECGVSASFLSDVELGKNYPSMEKAAAIAKGLKVSLSWLLGEEELREADEALVQSIEKNGMLYELFISKHVFPNGLTYEQMCDKINLLEKMEDLLIDKSKEKQKEK